MISFGNSCKLKATIIGYYDKSKKTILELNNFENLNQQMKYDIFYSQLNINNNKIKFYNFSNYYKKKIFLPEKTALFVPGQIVSAKSQIYNTWLRARIVKIRKFDDINKNKYKVKSIRLV